MREYPHFKNCKCGHGGQKLNPKHKWYLNAPQYDNCFWTYMRHNSRPHSLREVAEIFGVSMSAIANIERSALQRFRKKLRRKLNMKNYLEE